MEPFQAEIVCACGHRFAVADDGLGLAHECPICRVANVLPRQAAAGALSAASPERSPNGAARTAVRGTAVLGGLDVQARGELPAGTQVGPYRVVRRIGKGGMGTVYEATDQRGGERVALKVLSPELAGRSDFVARFERESRALADLSDERIARVFFSGAADGVPFFAMEYVDGHNLEEVLARERTLSGARVLEWMIEAARGLKAAADRGIIHRDIKPTNLLLDRDGRLRIVDFGLAKSVDSDSRLTVTGAVVGTPFYLSPEQGLGRPVDERSDIYSFGATFYHLLTGAPPFDAESPVSIILRHVNDPPEPLTRKNPRVAEPLARIVMRCLAKDPARRYHDWDELLEDLGAAQRGEPVTAPPEHASARIAGPSVLVLDELDDGARVLRRASRARRGFALLLDLAFVAVAADVAGRFLEMADAAWLAPVLAVLYFAWGDAAGGQTLFKRAFRLQVARPDGRSPGVLRSLWRGVLLIPIALLPFVNDLGSGLYELARHVSLPRPDLLRPVLFGWVAVDLFASVFSPKMRTLHDLLSGTCVFRRDKVKKRRKHARPSGPPLRAGAPVSPLLAATLSLLPGLGQLANREAAKGLVLFAGFLVIAVSAPPALLLLVPLSMFDAWRGAARRGE